MTLTVKRLLAPLTVFTIVATSLSARADVMIGDTVDLTFEGISPGRSVDWSLGSSDGGATAGVFNWAGDLKTFCVQLTERTNRDETETYDVVGIEAVPDNPPGPGPLGAARAMLIQDLFSRYYDSVMSKTGNAAKNHAAAFQIVVWEITHESEASGTTENILSDLDIRRGFAEFDASNTVENLAENMLESLGTGGFLSTISLAGLTNANYQDQIIVVPSTVPGIGSLAAIAGLGLARSGRRRR